MSRAVLMSIRPEWVKHIFITQDKLYEVRKRLPRIKPPYKVYVYCTLSQPLIYKESMLYKGNVNGYVCGEFTVIKHIEVSPPFHNKAYGTCLTDADLAKYANGKSVSFMQIFQPKMYLKPIELKEFDVNRPPQSFQFVEEKNNG